MQFNSVLIKRFQALVFTLAALAIACACKRDSTPIVIDKAATTLAREQGVRVYRGKPFTGKIVTRHPSGQIATSENYINGKRNGALKKWFDNGVLGFESYYSRGKLHGLTKSWWPNGNQRSKLIYKDGVVHGTSLHWYKSGERFKQMHYVNGSPEGIQQAWRPNGKLYSNYEYKNGRVFGLKKSNLCFGLEDENYF